MTNWINISEKEYFHHKSEISRTHHIFREPSLFTTGEVLFIEDAGLVKHEVLRIEKDYMGVRYYRNQEIVGGL